LPVARKKTKQEAKWNGQGLFFRVLFLKQGRRKKTGKPQKDAGMAPGLQRFTNSVTTGPQNTTRKTMDQDDEKILFDYADKFINLANELARSDTSGRVGMAIRFAAARFSVFEASTQTASLAAEKDTYLPQIAEDFQKVLEYNFEDYVRILADQKH
jgi:hypothetical protein